MAKNIRKNYNLTYLLYRYYKPRNLNPSEEK